MCMVVDMQHCDIVGCAVGVIVVSMLDTSRLTTVNNESVMGGC